MKLKKNQILELEQLDELLDLPVSGFEKGVRRLVKDVATKNVRFRIPAMEAIDSVDSRVGITGIYQAELRRLSRMDRSEEFRMAKRHEFLCERAKAALKAAGHPAEALDELVALPFDRLPKLKTRKSLRYLKHALDELHELRQRYVEGALYLVTGTAYRYRGLGVDLVDLVQEGNASLFQAIDGFDWRRDVRFKTYAQYWIQQAVLKTLYNSSRTVRIPVWVQKLLHKVQKLRAKSDPKTGDAMSLSAIAQELDVPEERIEELMGTRRYAVSLDAALPGDDGSSLGSLLADDSLEPVPEQIQDSNLDEHVHEVLSGLSDREQVILTRRFGLGGTDPETLSEIAGDLGITAERVRQVQNAALGKLKGSETLQRLADV